MFTISAFGWEFLFFHFIFFSNKNEIFLWIPTIDDDQRKKTCQRFLYHLGTPHHQVLGHAIVIKIFVKYDFMGCIENMGHN